MPTTSSSTMSRPHALAALLLIGALYLLARNTGWTGPNATVPVVDALMLLVVLITIWGLVRLARGRGE